MLTWACAGCGTVDISKVSAPPPVSAKAQAAQRDDLKVTVDPFLTQEGFKDYFGCGKPGKEIVVLHLKAENNSPSAAWILQKANLQLMAQDGRGGSIAGPDQAGLVIAGEVLANIGVAFLALPLAVPGNLIATDATVVEHNFMLREWLDTTIYPGKSREGFVYFKLNAPQPDNRYSLHVSALDARSQQTNTLAVPFTYETP